MNNRLRGLISVVAAISVGGVTYLYATREPPNITMAELRDAGAVSERDARWVFCAPEHLDRKTRNQLRDNGYGEFRVGSVHRICRVVWQYDGVDVPGFADASVALSLSNVFGDAGVDDDAGSDENAVSSLAVFSGGYRLECNNADGGLNELRFLSDGGFRYQQDAGVEDPFCSASNRPGRVTPPCVVPDCWTRPDGGWDDTAVVDCLGMGRFGVPVWAGCAVMPASISSGTQCVPVECVVSGNEPIDVLR